MSFGACRKFHLQTIAEMNEATLSGLYSDELLWCIVAASNLFFFLEVGGIVCLLACSRPAHFRATSHFNTTFLWQMTALVRTLLYPFLSRACRLWKDTACSFAPTLSLPGEKSSSVPSFTFNASPFIFCNSLCVESAFLIKLFASCICTIHSLWGHFYYSRRVVICNKSQE